MPLSSLSRFIVLPELKIAHVTKIGVATCLIECHRLRKPEYCPRCAAESSSTYDHRYVRVKDTPIHGHGIVLRVKKRRLWCKPCGLPFTEPVPGVRKGFSHTERYGRALRFACDRYSSLKQVQKDYRCSPGFLYKTYYRHLELRAKQQQYPWPKVIGIDEHSFKRNKQYGNTEFASLIVDHSNKRVMEVCEGKTTAGLEEQLKHIPGRENVKFATLDLCDPFKNFVRNFFPNGKSSTCHALT